MMSHKTMSTESIEQQQAAEKDSLYRLGLRLTGSAAEAEYLVRETFRRAWEFWDTYEHGNDIHLWLGRILKDSFIVLYRRKKSEAVNN